MYRFDLLSFNEEQFKERYTRKLYNAVRRGLYKAAPSVLLHYQQDGLDNTKKARVQRAKFKIRKNNTLAFIDSGHDARIREHGATIRAQGGGYLKVVVDPKHRENLRRDAAKNRTTDIFPLKRGKEIFLLERGRTKKPKLVAVLKKQVTRAPLHENDRLRGIVSHSVPYINAAVKAEIDKMGEI